MKLARTIACLAVLQTIFLSAHAGTPSILEETSNSQSAAASSIAKAFASNVTAGSTIHVFAAVAGNGATTISFADNNGGSYTVLDTIFDSNTNYVWADAVAVNHAAGATTVTATFSSSGTFPAIIIREVGGAAASSLDGHAALVGTSGQGTLSVSPSNAKQPALASCLAASDGVSAVPSFAAGASNSVTYGTNMETGSGAISTTGSRTVSISSSAGTPVLVCAVIDGIAGGIPPSQFFLGQ